MLKRDSGKGVIMWILRIFYVYFFYITPPVAASDKWIKNKMIVIPDKFKAIIITKNKLENISEHFQILNNKAELLPSAKLLGVEIDNRFR